MTGKDLGFLKWVHEKCLEYSNHRDYLLKALDETRTVTISISEGEGAVWKLSREEIIALIDYYEDKRLFYTDGFKNTELSINNRLKTYYEEFQGGYVEVEE